MILAETGMFDLLGPILGVLIGVAALIGLIAVARKWMTSDEPDEPGTGGFSLGSLRDLVRQGKMTQAEYDAAKAKIVEAAHRNALQPPPATAARKGGVPNVDR